MLTASDSLGDYVIKPAHLLPAMAADEFSTEHGAGDFLAIDDLLDFSNDDIIEAAPVNIVSSPEIDKNITPHEQFADAACVFDSDKLCVPCDDLAELEWLSNFVEESFSSGDHVPANFCLTSVSGEKESEKRNLPWMNESFCSTSPSSVLDGMNGHSSKPISFGAPSDTSVVPARTRSKRCHTAICFWNTQILSADATESILESLSTTASTMAAASSESNMLPTSNYYDNYEEDDDDYIEEDENDNEEEDDIDVDDSFEHSGQQRRVVYRIYKVKKFGKLNDSTAKPKKRAKGGEVVDDGVVVRKCLHCGSMKTPQWRAGPRGPKTLCNACGVRYKSGRLCAEYRPAASPTFNQSVHSNSHRKVMEIRRQRGELSSPIIAKLPAASRFDRLGNAQFARVKQNLMSTTYPAAIAVDH